MKKLVAFLFFVLLATTVTAQDYKRDFISPTDNQRPLIIWQWMVL